MTSNKRFKNVDINHMENLIEMWDNDAWHTFTEKGLESFMNELNNENVELHQFKEKVFEIINKTIERETRIAESIEKTTLSPPGSAINRGTISTLENLKMELEE